VGFFVLEHPTDPVDDALTDFHPAAGTKRGHAPLCPRCGDPIGMKMRLAPIRAELETLGKRFGDLAFGVSNDVLVSERFKDAFLSSGLIGLSGFMPAQIVKVIARRGKITSPMPNYFVAVPGRSRALIDDRASGIDYERRWTCEECRIGQMKRLRRVVLEPGTLVRGGCFHSAGASRYRRYIGAVQAILRSPCFHQLLTDSGRAISLRPFSLGAGIQYGGVGARPKVETRAIDADAHRGYQKMAPRS
jgi:hypothetical protein